MPSRGMDIRVTYSDTGGDGPRPLPAVACDLQLGRHRLRLRAGAYCRFDAMWSNHPHLHRDYHELCYVLEGRGEFSHGGTRHALGPGSVFVADPGVTHEISSPRTRDLLLVFLTIRIDRRPLPLGREWADALVDRFLADHRVAADGVTHVRPLLDLLGPGGGAEVAAQRHRRCLEMLALEGMAALASSRPPPVDETAGREPMLERALAYIDRNTHRTLDVDEIATAVGCSSRHLRRIVRRHRGCTVVAMVNERRFNYAAGHLLMQFSVAEAAAAIGIASTPQFCREFKARFGETPRRYQARHASPERAAQTEHTPERRQRRPGRVP